MTLNERCIIVNNNDPISSEAVKETKRGTERAAEVRSRKGSKERGDGRREVGVGKGTKEIEPASICHLKYEKYPLILVTLLPPTFGSSIGKISKHPHLNAYQVVRPLSVLCQRVAWRQSKTNRHFHTGFNQSSPELPQHANADKKNEHMPQGRARCS